MNTYIDVKCPQCGSIQLTENASSNSNEDLINHQPSTNRSRNVETTITCSVCGQSFNTEEAIMSQNFQTATHHTQITHSTSNNKSIPGAVPKDPMDVTILEIAIHHGKIAAVKYCKEATGWDLKTSKNYVEQLTGESASGKGGCFVATACYGDYNAPEVLVLRTYRDQQLLTHPVGKILVQLYYIMSPPVAKLISKSNRTKAFIRNHLLKYLVASVQKKELLK